MTHSDVYLFAAAILKVLLVTGIGPGLAIFFFVRTFLRVGPEYDANLLVSVRELTRRRPALNFRRKAA